MNKLFDLDSPLMRFLSRMTDLVFLSFLWFLCCIPIITIGPSTAAMYHVTLKLARDEEELKVIPCFFKGFKDNFKQGLIFNLIFIVVGTVLALDYLIMINAEGTAGAISSGCFLAMGIWMLCIMFYTYPLQAQFYNPIRRTLMNAAILSLRKLLDTVIVFVLNMIPVFAAFYAWPIFIRLLPLWILLAPGCIALLCSKRFVKLFDPYLQPAENPEEIQEETEE